MTRTCAAIAEGLKVGWCPGRIPQHELIRDLFPAEGAQSRWSAAERAIALRHTASHTIEKRFTRAVEWVCVEPFRDDLRTRSGASGFASGSAGSERPKAQRGPAQMITSPTKRLGVCAGEQGRHCLRVAKPWQQGSEIFSARLEMLRERLLSAPQ